MPSLNKCLFMGNLGRDPEMRYTPSGQPVTNFSLAVNRRWQKDGEWQEETTWVNCVLWGPSAERAAESLRKGNLAFVEGRYEDSTWEDKESGKKMHRAVFTVSSFQNLTKKEERESTSGDNFNPAMEYAAQRAERDWSDQEEAPAKEPVRTAPVRSEGRTDLDDLPF